MSLFMNLSLNQITAIKVYDRPGDPFDKSAELFQTYSISELDVLGGTSSNELKAGDKAAKAVDVAAAKEEGKKGDVAPAKVGEAKAAWMRLGFSTGGAPGGGVKFKKNDVKKVIDRILTFAAPRALTDGQTRRFRLDFHSWESDGASATRNVRAAFSDSNLSALVKAYEAAGGDATDGGREALPSCPWLPRDPDAECGTECRGRRQARQGAPQRLTINNSPSPFQRTMGQPHSRSVT